MMMPPAVLVSAAAARTITRSWRGVMLSLVVLAISLFMFFDLKFLDLLPSHHEMCQGMLVGHFFSGCEGRVFLFTRLLTELHT
jgi:hypothetical protein